MRPSKLLHPVAVLRQILDLKQKELADLLECSADTIRSIELRRLGLSEELAERIAEATYVGVAWLLAGDPKAEPIDDIGQPYERTFFESAQANRRKGSAARSYMQKSYTKENADAEARYYAKRLGALILKAAHRGRLRLVDWQINDAISRIEERYEEPFQPKGRGRKKKK